VDTLRDHWPEYLIEGWALGTFMVSAGLVTTLLEAPASPVHAAIGNDDLRRVVIGIAMGLTAIALIYSPWGRRSGAHMNPAVTLTFWRLGKVSTADACGYVLAQFCGGTLGVLLVATMLGHSFTAPPVNYVSTLPGPAGQTAAFAAEMAISFGLMVAVLYTSNVPRLAPTTGIVAGCLVATYISVEAPLSGMSMNPARSFASALPGSIWTGAWIYFTAPVIGMLGAASAYQAIRGDRKVGCAKLFHALDVRCIHCGYEPPASTENSHDA
jgi:aquaporin Z